MTAARVNSALAHPMQALDRNFQPCRISTKDRTGFGPRDLRNRFSPP